VRRASSRVSLRSRRFGRSRRSFRLNSRGVSEVVATILLLGLTVTLFSSIFFFVNTFPRPPSQSASQFQGSLQFTPNGAYITNVLLLHLSGQVLSSPVTTIYLRSAVNPSFYSSQYTIAQGLNGSNDWALGQTWNISLTSTGPQPGPSPNGDPIGDNLTVYIISGTQLIFTVTLPGQVPALAPYFTNFGTKPSPPVVAQAFNITIYVSSTNLNTHSVYVNLSQLPGASGSLLNAQKMSKGSLPGEYYYDVPAGVTSNSGTYYVVFNATDASTGIRGAQGFTLTIQTPSSPSTLLTVGAVNLTAVHAAAKTPNAYFSALVSDLAIGGGIVNVTVWFNISINGGAFTLIHAPVTGMVGPGGTITLNSAAYTSPATSAIGQTWVLEVTATATGLGEATGTVSGLLIH
jgi:FlaG/FlaF family flagellin (archaellin)